MNNEPSHIDEPLSYRHIFGDWGTECPLLGVKLGEDVDGGSHEHVVLEPAGEADVVGVDVAADDVDAVAVDDVETLDATLGAHERRLDVLLVELHARPPCAPSSERSGRSRACR